MKLKNIWQWLTEPPVFIEDPEHSRRQIRLLSALLIFLMPLTLAGAFFQFIYGTPQDLSFILMVGAVIIFVIAYGLIRNKYYQLASILTTGIIALLPLITVIVRADYSSFRVNFSLIWLVLAILLGSMLFSLRGAVIFAFINISSTLLLALLIPEITFRTVFPSTSVLFVLSILIIIAAKTRNQDLRQIEKQSQKLTESEEKYRQLFSAGSDAIIIFNANTKQIVDINDKALNLYGYDRENFFKLKYCDIVIKPEQTKKLIKQIVAGNLKKIPLRYHKKKDGTIFPVEISASVITLKGHKIICATIRDITERKKTEEELLIRNSAIESSISGIGITDIEGKLIYVNDAVVRMWGYKNKNELIGRYLPEFWHGERIFQTIKNLKEKGVDSGEDIGKRKDGSLFHILFSANVIKSKDGNLLAMLGAFMDITERKKTEEKLKLFNEGLEKKVKERTKDLEHVNKERTDFIADASHELRTPLTIVKSNLDLILRKKLKKSVNVPEALSVIGDEVERMSEIVSDLAMTTQVDARDIKRQKRAEVNFGQLIRKVVRKSRPLAKDKNISLNVKQLDEVILWGDEGELEKLLMNLMSNAIAYNKTDGRVQIGLVREKNYANMIVSDNGIGISQKDIAYVFDRFYRADKARSRQTGGTGLGLAICKWVVETHGGSINLKSKYGKGSTFTVHLPLKEKKV